MEVGLRDYATNLKDLIEVSLKEYTVHLVDKIKVSLNKYAFHLIDKIVSLNQSPLISKTNTSIKQVKVR